MILRYIIFAIISIAINLLTQYFVLIFADVLCIAMFFGTFLGLITKYFLDKKFIFYYRSKNKIDDGKKFFMYSFFGIFTTLVFWGFEISFDAVFKSDLAKYVGALLGLVIGYILKYFLDKNFVFKEKV
jgi:hypothetical protein